MIARLLLLAAGISNLFLAQGWAQTFEVASIRVSEYQSADGEGGRRESIETAADRLTMRNVTLRSCISWAYNVQDFQVTGSLGAERFDIAAKAPGAVPVADLRAMLGTLLSERFKLRFHRDTKELSSLDLVVVKGGHKLRVSKDDSPGVFRPNRAAMVAEHATM